MAQRRFHYELAFEHFLRANRLPYIAVDEAKKTLAPADLAACGSIKSFDFVVHLPDRALLVDVKGRAFGSSTARRSASNARLENWVTEDDVAGLTHWQQLFGARFQAVFIFEYELKQQPPDALFESVFAFNDRWYALRECPLGAYRRCVKTRSLRWRTVHVPAEDFSRISRPFHASAASGGPSPGSSRTARSRLISPGSARRRDAGSAGPGLRLAGGTPILQS